MKTLKNNKGAVLVEFVIVVPLLLILIFGSIEFGILFFNKAMITNASREGARAGIRYNGTTEVQPDEIEAVVRQYCENNLITFGTDSPPDALSVDVERDGTSAGDALTVTVDYNYGFLVLDRLDFFGKWGFSDGIQLNGQAVMRQE